VSHPPPQGILQTNRSSPGMRAPFRPNPILQVRLADACFKSIASMFINSVFAYIGHISIHAKLGRCNRWRSRGSYIPTYQWTFWTVYGLRFGHRLNLLLFSLNSDCIMPCSVGGELAFFLFLPNTHGLIIDSPLLLNISTFARCCAGKLLYSAAPHQPHIGSEELPFHKRGEEET
jgi:hypothetical protein